MPNIQVLKDSAVFAGKPVGASLLAIATWQSTSRLDVQTQSRAGSLPQRSRTNRIPFSTEPSPYQIVIYSDYLRGTP
ncbi:hypothetical protein C0J56_23720 [Pseudomonas fluorescens]|nr:hypothetical protein C0J56_23720 [Pseudomonas fluorescens]